MFFLVFSLLIINIKFKSIHTTNDINNVIDFETNQDAKIYLDGSNRSHLMWFIQV
jgi:hypothetical protein